MKQRRTRSGSRQRRRESKRRKGEDARHDQPQHHHPDSAPQPPLPIVVDRCTEPTSEVVLEGYDQLHNNNNKKRNSPHNGQIACSNKRGNSRPDHDDKKADADSSNKKQLKRPTPALLFDEEAVDYWDSSKSKDNEDGIQIIAWRKRPPPNQSDAFFAVEDAPFQVSNNSKTRMVDLRLPPLLDFLSTKAYAIDDAVQQDQPQIEAMLHQIWKIFCRRRLTVKEGNTKQQKRQRQSSPQQQQQQEQGNNSNNNKSNAGCDPEDRQPTLIQRYAWSLWLNSPRSQHLNYILLAPTGSGKTLAYGLPLILHAIGLVNSLVPSSGALVLVPTRELAFQVTQELQHIETAIRLAIESYAALAIPSIPITKTKYGSQAKPATELVILTCVGGTDKGAFLQNWKLATKEGHHPVVICATPGRMCDTLCLKTKGRHDAPGSSSQNDGRSSNNGNCSSVVDDKNDGDGDAKVSATTASVWQQQWLGQINTVVLDEADRMAENTDLAQQITSVLEALQGMRHDLQQQPSALTLCLCSATQPEKVKACWHSWLDLVNHHEHDTSSTTTLAIQANGMYLNRDKHVVVTDSKSAIEKQSNSETTCVPVREEDQTTKDRKGASIGQNSFSSAPSGTTSNARVADWVSLIPSNLNQVLHVCSQHKKPRKLLHTLEQILHKHQSNDNNEKQSTLSRNMPLGIVFFARIQTLLSVAKFLPSRTSFAATQLHSHLDQKTRQRAIQCFQSGKTPLLLATDIAARGLHVRGVRFVINYDFPGTIEQYIHRCGRAGRGSSSQLRGGALSSSSSSSTSTAASKARSACSPDAVATIYSYFTRSMAPMATAVVAVLDATNQWVDPNLRLLMQPEETETNGISSTIRKETSHRKNLSTSRDRDDDDHVPVGVKQVHQASSSSSSSCPTDNDSDTGEFANLSLPQGVVLKRAEYVSDASETEEEDGDVR